MSKPSPDTYHLLDRLVLPAIQTTNKVGEIQLMAGNDEGIPLTRAQFEGGSWTKARKPIETFDPDALKILRTLASCANEISAIFLELVPPNFSPLRFTELPQGWQVEIPRMRPGGAQARWLVGGEGQESALSLVQGGWFGRVHLDLRGFEPSRVWTGHLRRRGVTWGINFQP